VRIEDWKDEIGSVLSFGGSGSNQKPLSYAMHDATSIKDFF
jgi:hypothetical protein